VELVGIEPTTSSLRMMASSKKPSFGVHFPADHVPKRSMLEKIQLVRESCLTIFPAGDPRCGALGRGISRSAVSVC